jgi:hypothetical protein
VNRHESCSGGFCNFSWHGHLEPDRRSRDTRYDAQENRPDQAKSWLGAETAVAGGVQRSGQTVGTIVLLFCFVQLATMFSSLCAPSSKPKFSLRFFFSDYFLVFVAGDYPLMESFCGEHSSALLAQGASEMTAFGCTRQ